MKTVLDQIHHVSRSLTICVAALLLGMAGSAVGETAWTYNSATDVPLSGTTFTASGSITLALNFAPETGTNLTVINTTGLDFINGEFSNLAHGQEVTMRYSGITYRFVANYFGGTGNDLLLLWANVRTMSCGDNTYSQLGRNSSGTEAVLFPVDSGVLGNKTVVAVTAGEIHSLALCSDGTMAAWGDNSVGQLGSVGSTGSPVPVAVEQSGVLAAKTVIAVSAGYFHNLALCSDGTVAAWGKNGDGQLGNNSFSDSPVPVEVSVSGALSGKTVVAVSAGGFHSLALCSDGTLVTWGANMDGQLGNNSTNFSLIPVAVDQSGVLAGKAVIRVSAGSSYCLVLCSDGTMGAWGWNFQGELGDNSYDLRKAPVFVDQSGVLAGKSVVQIATGHQSSLALCSDGTLAAWGKNSNGQLGDNSTVSRNGPVLVSQGGVLADKVITSISAGADYSLALCSGGSLAAWGSSQSGQLGANLAGADSLLPVLALTTGLTTAERFVVAKSGCSAFHTLALAASPPPPSSYATWAGTNANGQSPGNDYDHDGVQNGVEYFLNSPAGFTIGSEVAANTVTWPNGGNIPSTDYGIQFVLQISLNLSTWTNIQSTDSNLLNTSASVSYTLPSGEEKIFVRLVVTPD